MPEALRGISLEDARNDLDAALTGTDGINRATTIFPREPRTTTAQIVHLPAAKPATPVEDEPKIPFDLADWLIQHPELVPQRLPAPQGDTFHFSVRRHHNLRTAEITVERRNRQDQVARRSLLQPGQATLCAAPKPITWSGQLRCAGLDQDDAMDLTNALQRLRQGDAEVFAGLVHCASCGRRLTDPISRKYGVGPICASRWGITLPTTLPPALKESDA
jgi:hypothetical protein